MTSDDVVIAAIFSHLKDVILPDLKRVIDGKYFERYPSTDIRNTFTGLTSGWDIRELDGSPGLSSQEGLQNISGIGNAMGATDKFAGIPMYLLTVCLLNYRKLLSILRILNQQHY